MRKGRSQRKTRGSLPPTSKRPQSRLNAASGASGGPQVVVGLTAPRSEDSFDARGEGRAPLETLETLETRARESERLELVREKSLEIVRESLELVRESLELHEDEPVQEQESYLAESVEPPHAETHPETLTFDPPAAFHDAADDEPVNVEATAPVKTEATPPPTPDETSIPPMGDLSVEPIADRFFSEGEFVAARGIHEHEDWDERAHKSVRKSLPEVVQRRAKFAKYVRWAVGGAAVVCLAALARTAIPPSAPVAASRASLEAREAPVAKAAAVALAAEPVKAPESVAAPIVAVPAAAPAADPVKTAEPEPAVAAPAPPAPAAEPSAVATSDKTALQEKNDARRALERGKDADAIAAGERSVALDPTDGEAWLLLGAAYQDKGKNAEARRCYSSCLKEGKRGPLGECRAMIR